ncbi:hypothetical protein [Domibacillus sp.]|uniref:hypothetical protein n=1 Tax=Domibacillus sp. TaxID=1969783 RepID=UPI00281250FE|nr:hypothetical protein [Domibacillus sp.]
MNRHQVCQLLVNHHREKGKEMGVVEMIIACGETEPAQILDGHRMFSRYLDNLRMEIRGK